MTQLSKRARKAKTKAKARPKPPVATKVVTIPFPAPKVINGRNFYGKGEVLRWRAAVAGLPDPEPQPDDEVWLTSRQVRDLFGGVSDMWLWRKRATVDAEADHAVTA